MDEMDEEAEELLVAEGEPGSGRLLALWVAVGQRALDCDRDRFAAILREAVGHFVAAPMDADYSEPTAANWRVAGAQHIEHSPEFRHWVADTIRKLRLEFPNS